MKGLIEVKGNELVTTSLVIADLFGRKHSHVLRALDRLSTRLKIVPSEYKDSSGKCNKMYTLDERSFLIAMPFIGGNKSEEGQIALVDAFLKMRKELTRQREQRLAVDWQEARANGKCIRTVMARAVQCLERLADKQGGIKGRPENRHYYEATTKMVYKALFGDSSLKNVRDKLDVLQLTFLSICEQACADEIQSLVELQVDYHDIYAECKKRVIATVEGLSASRLTSGGAVKLAWDGGGRAGGAA